MPNHTFLSKNESIAPGHKPSKNRLTLLLGRNLAGEKIYKIIFCLKLLTH